MSYKSQVRDKLWALLEGYNPPAPIVSVAAAFQVSSRIKNPSADASLKNILLQSPNFYPKLEITDGRFTHSGYTQPKMTFGMQAAATIDDVADWDVQRKLVFFLTITGRDQTVSIDDAEEAVQNAILLGGPLLGLPAFVSSWDAMTATRKNDKDNRPQSVITLPVNLSFSGAALRTELTT